MNWTRILGWFKRHKGWTGMFIFTLVLSGVASGLEYVMGNDYDYAFELGIRGGWVWFGYLVLWAIHGRKVGW